MKKLFLMFLATGLMSGACAQDNGTIKLNEPNRTRGEATMTAFEKRRSTREYSDAKLSFQDLSDLLWAANGINRPADGKRTAPTAMNKQEIDVYVCMEDGAYLYDVPSHELRRVTQEDVRPYVAGQQEFVKSAPACLVIVADMERVGNDEEPYRTMTAIDAGIVSQNISIFCAGCGLATVPRGFMDKEKLAEALGLGTGRIIHLNHPVGYFRE
ncbi:SagB/ThcOx family dehydrogenase [Alistipes sp. OttesenSCG-928-B03]|nr:SagB/ThcOx family dehydrogenase [Alistipes sp. OttesenSCG-928-B03]